MHRQPNKKASFSKDQIYTGDKTVFKTAKKFLVPILMLATCLAVQAQTSNRPVTIVVPFGAGGSTDVMARIVATKMASVMNRPVIVDNKPGASSRLAAGLVKNMAADGSFVLLALTTTASIAPTLYAGQVNYDFKTDYTPVAQIAKSQLVISVRNNSKFKDARDLVAEAKKTPGQMNIGTGGVGTMAHFLLYQLEKTTQTKTTMIPYKGGSNIVSDVLAGQLDGAVDSVGDHVEQHRAKKMRILGVFGAKRSPLVPDVPTMKEQGIDLDSESWYGFFVPSKTPKPAVIELQDAVATALKDPDIQARLNGLGMHPNYLNSADFSKMMIADAEYWSAIVRSSGIKPE